jgi:hypothetical protein
MLSLAAVTTASRAVADCSRPPSALTALKQSDLVFRGTVQDVTITGGRGTQNITPAGSDHHPDWGGKVVRFDVSRVWKGAVGTLFFLRSVSEKPDDAFTEFDRGREYLVFARRNSPQQSALFNVAGATYGATGCGGTTSLVWGMKYLVELGPGYSPEPVRNLSPGGLRQP